MSVVLVRDRLLHKPLEPFFADVIFDRTNWNHWSIIFILLWPVIAIIKGWVFDLFIKRSILLPNHNRVKLTEGFQFRQNKKRNFCKKIRFLFFEEVILDGIVESKIGGMLIIIWNIARSDSQNYFGPTFIGLPVTVIMAAVIELCSES